MSTDDGCGDDLLMSEQAWFALSSASRAVTDVYRPLLAERGLTYPQYLVLLVPGSRSRGRSRTSVPRSRSTTAPSRRCSSGWRVPG